MNADIAFSRTKHSCMKASNKSSGQIIVLIDVAA